MVFAMDYLKKGIHSIQDAMHSPTYYKLGDAIANLVYCMSKAKITMDLDGRLDIVGSSKVSARILREAITRANAKAKSQVGAKGGAHEIADVAEAILAYGWLNNMVTIEECAELVARPVIAKKPAKLREEWEAFSEGFSDVFAKILLSSKK